MRIKNVPVYKYVVSVLGHCYPFPCWLAFWVKCLSPLFFWISARKGKQVFRLKKHGNKWSLHWMLPCHVFSWCQGCFFCFESYFTSELLNPNRIFVLCCDDSIQMLLCEQFIGMCFPRRTSLDTWSIRPISAPYFEVASHGIHLISSSFWQMSSMVLVQEAQSVHF